MNKTRYTEKDSLAVIDKLLERGLTPQIFIILLITIGGIPRIVFADSPATTLLKGNANKMKVYTRIKIKSH